MSSWKTVISAVSTLVACLSTGAASAQTELFEFLPLDGVAFSEFGRSVAIDGGIAVVGAPFDNEHGAAAGAAYVFDATTGAQLFKLFPDDGAAGDLFGFTVAIDGNLAVVGAPEASYPMNGIFGAAYVFDVTTGMQIAKLIPDNISPLRRFGGSLAIEGNTAAVGDDQENAGASVSGAVYLFDLTTGLESLKLVSPSPRMNGGFGRSVSIDAGRVCISEPGADVPGNLTGAAWVFDTTTGLQLQEFRSPEPSIGDGYGSAVAIDGEVALVSAELEGRVYRYLVSTGQEICPRWTSSVTSYGFSVALDGGHAVIGSAFDSDAAPSAGAAHVFGISDFGAELFKLTASDAAAGDAFGVSVAISGDRILVGALFTDDNGSQSGSAYLFDFEACPLSDINNDGVVDTADLGILIGEFGDTCP